MSDVSEDTFDVFVACANPEHSTAHQALETRRQTRASSAGIRAMPSLLEPAGGRGDEEEDGEEGDPDDDDEGEGGEEEEEEGGEEEEEEGAGGDDDDEEEEGGEEQEEGEFGKYVREVEREEGDDEDDDEDADDEDDDGRYADEDDDLEGGRSRPASPPPPPLSPARPRSAVSAAPPRPVGSRFAEYVRSAPPRAKTEAELQAETMEKQSLLLDFERLRTTHRIPLTRDWSMEDDLDDMNFEMRRIMLQIDEQSNVKMMKNGLHLACTGIEMMSRRFGLLDLDGWSAEVSSDMAKHERSLARLYRKYWRRSHSSTPEADLAMSLVSSMGMFHMRKVMSKRMFRGGGGGGGGGMGASRPPFGGGAVPLGGGGGGGGGGGRAAGGGDLADISDGDDEEPPPFMRGRM
jgi:hypothetical protein